MSFFNSKNKTVYTLSISLKSSSINFQLIYSTQQHIKEVLFVERHVILLQNSQDPLLYTTQYMKELAWLFEKNHLKIKELVKDNQLSIHFILYSPWFTSKINTIKHLEPVIINEKFLTKKLEQIEEGEQLTTLEKRVIKIQSKGYALDYLTNTKAEDVYLQVYSSYISKQIEKLLTEVISKYFPFKKEIFYTTIPLRIFDNIKDLMIKEDNITFIHIGEEITEIGIIKDDSIDYFITFPIGIHDFLREIQSNIKTYDYDLIYQKEIQIKSEINKKQLDSLKKTWCDSLYKAIGLFKGIVPNKILIITNQKVMNFFSETLADSIMSGQESPLVNHRIINFDISLLKDIITYKTPVGENEFDLKLEALI